MDRDAALLVRTLDHDARHAGLLQPFAQMLADLDVFLEELAVVLLARIPPGIPGTVDAEAQADRIDLLTHQAVSFAVFAGFFAAGVLSSPRALVSVFSSS